MSREAIAHLPRFATDEEVLMNDIERRPETFKTVVCDHCGRQFCIKYIDKPSLDTKEIVHKGCGQSMTIEKILSQLGQW